MTGNKMPRIPLEERLKKKKSLRADFLNIFSTYIDDYHKALSQISGDAYFMNIFLDELKIIEYDKEHDVLPIMAQFVAELDWLPREQKTSILFHTLIEPFIRIKNFDLERSRENNG